MRSYHLDLGAGLEGLSLKEHPAPQPGPGQVLVRVQAVSLNFRELSILLRGTYPLPVKRDVVAVSDGAGTVAALGPGVTRVAVGDRVVASIFPRWLDGPFELERSAQLGGSLDGMLTELAVLEEESLSPIPPHLSYEEAATLPCAALTAWNALTGGRPLRAGETVLVLGSGGVSLFALQLARTFGAQVVATTSSEAKAALLRALGATEVVNRGAFPDWGAEVLRRTEGRGADHVVEVGGMASLAQSLRALAMGGELAWVGALADPVGAIDPTPLLRKVASMRAVAVGSLAQFRAMNRAVTVNRLRPVIDRVFGFDEAREAFAYYAAGGGFGKIVIRVGAGAEETR
jgi:NADPH:quinone reductase-like Zn-dependent oxidoreductase